MSEMARAISARGTSIGTKAELAGPMKARAPPNTAATAKMAAKLGTGRKASARRTRTQAVSTARLARMMPRRSRRSAVEPARSDRQNSGTNWARPTMPTRKALSSTPRVARASA